MKKLILVILIGAGLLIVGSRGLVEIVNNATNLRENILNSMGDQ